MELTHAVENNDLSEITMILSAGATVNPNAKDHRGMTALHHACQAGMSEAVTLLLAHPATNPNAQDYQGMTALHYVCI